MPKKLDKKSSPTAGKVMALAARQGRKLDLRQSSQLSDYLSLLIKWNSKMNLVGPFNWEEVLTQLVVDSWYLADFLQDIKLPQSLVSLDLGAGAGLPGIPLRCMWQAGDYYLVEPRQKRAIFMQQAVRNLALSKTKVLNMGYEQIDPQLLPVDLVVSRAFRPWREFLGIAGSLLRPGGRVVVMASKPCPEENVPGWELQACKPYEARGKKAYLWSFTSINGPS